MHANRLLLLFLTLSALMLTGCAVVDFFKGLLGMQNDAPQVVQRKIIPKAQTVEVKAEQDPDELAKPLLDAAKKGDIPNIRGLMAKGTSIKLKTKDGYTALMYAAAANQLDTVNFLLDEGAEINEKDGKNGSTALIYATASGHKETVKTLLTRGADSSIANSAGKTALQIALDKKNEEVVRLLDKEGKFWHDEFKGKISYVGQAFLGEKGQEENQNYWRDELFQAKGDGSAPARLTFFNEVSYTELHGPSYSPDGSKLIFSAGQNSQQTDLYVLEFGTEAPKKITDNLLSNSYGGFSPDGKSIVFSAERDQQFNFDVYSADTDGENVTRLTDIMAWDGQPSFTPDGKKILFISIRDTLNKMFLMDIDGKNPVKLTCDTREETECAMSPDGKSVVFTSKVDDASLSEIFMVGSDGTNEVQLTDMKGTDERYPCFSPDGKQVAFVSYNPANAKLKTGSLIIMDLDTKKQTKVTDRVKVEKISWIK
ncbi:MAG: ankyrin repeat domain-containing protein [Candidatus Wallbacteria bacterium]|nr:ankyrin repeat domain-containing protein [Candidatus Wallbacteria bacterium]